MSQKCNYDRLRLLRQRSSQSFFVPGDTFWNLAQETIGKVADDIRENFEERDNIEKAPVHKLQDELDKCAWDWVCGADSSQTCASLRGIQEFTNSYQQCHIEFTEEYLKLRPEENKVTHDFYSNPLQHIAESTHAMFEICSMERYNSTQTDKSSDGPAR